MNDFLSTGTRFVVGQRVTLHDKVTGVILTEDTRVESITPSKIIVQWYGLPNSYGGNNYIAEFHPDTLANLNPDFSRLEIVGVEPQTDEADKLT